jgi:Uma2 family endonuclease
MQSVQQRVGYADLLHLPEDGRRYEIHGGELVVVPSPLPQHQLAVLAVVRLFDDYIARCGGLVMTAPLDIVLDEFDVVQPDVLFFRGERSHLVRPDAVTRHAPDIVVEVLSPSTAATDRGGKNRLFARHGVPEYWIVDPLAGQVEVHALDDGVYRETQVATGDETVHSVLLPDLTFEAARVFDRTQRNKRSTPAGRG